MVLDESRSIADVVPTPFVWHKSAEQILERLAGYCATINQDATA